MRRLAVIVAVLAGPVAAEPDPVAGEDVFQSLCASCHGTDAKGGGPLTKLMTIEPPDLTLLAASNDGVFPMFRVVRQIDGRDPMLAHGGDMPLFGQLFEFPDGAISSASGQPIITAQPIADVAAWLATIQE